MELEEKRLEVEEVERKIQFQLHLIMIIIAAVLVVISMTIHIFMPQDEFTLIVGTAALGFLFGKFTNGFNIKRRISQ